MRKNDLTKSPNEGRKAHLPFAFDFLKPPPKPPANDDEQMKREVKKEHHHDGNNEIHYQLPGIKND